jgi:putative ABC transport system permease protein
VAGRRFEPGRNEMIAGIDAVAEYEGLAIGSRVALRDSTWTVVGHFDGAGSAYGSEIWMDLAQARGTFRRQGGASTARVRLDRAELLPVIRERIREDPRFELDLIPETEWYAEQSRARAELIEAFAYLVAGIMAFGAIVAALNTMYSAVSARTVEIATLRALGFGNTPIVTSVLIEALLLALVGSLLGGAVVYLAFDGYATSTLNTEAYSQVAFEFAVTPELLLLGTCWSLALGFIGGLLPAVRAARLPILAALRAGS